MYSELREDEVDEDKGGVFVIKLFQDDVEGVDLLEDVIDIHEVGAPDVVDDLQDDFGERDGLEDFQVD